MNVFNGFKSHETFHRLTDVWNWVVFYWKKYKINIYKGLFTKDIEDLWPSCKGY